MDEKYLTDEFKPFKKHIKNQKEFYEKYEKEKDVSGFPRLFEFPTFEKLVTLVKEAKDLWLKEWLK